MRKLTTIENLVHSGCVPGHMQVHSRALLCRPLFDYQNVFVERSRRLSSMILMTERYFRRLSLSKILVFLMPWFILLRSTHTLVVSLLNLIECCWCGQKDPEGQIRTFIIMDRIPSSFSPQDSPLLSHSLCSFLLPLTFLFRSLDNPLHVLRLV